MIRISEARIVAKKEKAVVTTFPFFNPSFMLQDRFDLDLNERRLRLWGLSRLLL